jgi:hypothetical protein
MRAGTAIAIPEGVLHRVVGLEVGRGLRVEVAHRIVSARKLPQQYANGAPLKGELRQIAESAATFPRALQDAERPGPGEGQFSVVDFLVGAGGWLDRPAHLMRLAHRCLALRIGSTDTPGGVRCFLRNRIPQCDRDS